MVYQPPSAFTSLFLESFTEIIMCVTERPKSYCYLMGDFNLNLFKCNDKPTHDFMTLFYSFMFYPTIIKSTRVTKTTATIIDHIWTNNLEAYQSSGIIYSNISDHLLICALFNIDKPIVKVVKRMLHPAAIASLKIALNDINWELMNETGANETFNAFHNIFFWLFDEHCSLHQYKIKTKHASKPYITSAIANSIKIWNEL